MSMDSKRFLAMLTFVLVFSVALLGAAGVNAQTTDGLTGTSTGTSTSGTMNGTTDDTTTGTTNATTPGVPDTGLGGTAAVNVMVLIVSALVATLGARYYARHSAALR
jgi:hypothetical protein